MKARNDDLTEEERWDRLTPDDRRAVETLATLYPWSKAISLIESSAETRQDAAPQ